MYEIYAWTFNRGNTVFKLDISESNEDQWPDITSSEGVAWDTPTQSGNAQKESVASRIKPEVGDKERQLQEQARRLAAAAALEEEKARQREEQRKLAEMEERKRQEEEERLT